MSQLASLGEDGLIEMLRRFGVPSPANLNFTDDVALLSGIEGSLAISSDNLVEDIHFRRSTIAPLDLGYKCLAVSLSDLASKGAKPVGCLLSWSLPKNTEIKWVEEFLSGFSGLAREEGCQLLGGDSTASAEKIFVSVTVLGQVLSPKLRSQAQTGDVIAVTGTLGDSAAGFSWIEKEGVREQFTKLIFRHLRPTPRLKEGQWLTSLPEVHAMMDLSDGLWTDLPRLLKASGKSAVVECDHVPVSMDLKQFADAERVTLAQYSVFGGEDYELLLTVKGEAFERIKKDCLSQFRLPLTAIGKITAGGNPIWNSAHDLKNLKAFSHF